MKAKRKSNKGGEIIVLPKRVSQGGGGVSGSKGAAEKLKGIEKAADNILRPKWRRIRESDPC